MNALKVMEFAKELLLIDSPTGYTKAVIDFEFGGGDCIAIIFIPSETYWETQTGRSLSERKDILEFVAVQSAKDQTFNGTYKILDSFIELYKS